MLSDAQTSGGLLVSVPEGRGEEYAAACREAGATAVVIGEVVSRGEYPLTVET